MKREITVYTVMRIRSVSSGSIDWDYTSETHHEDRGSFTDKEEAEAVATAWYEEIKDLPYRGDDDGIYTITTTITI